VDSLVLHLESLVQDAVSIETGDGLRRGGGRVVAHKTKALAFTRRLVGEHLAADDVAEGFKQAVHVGIAQGAGQVVDEQVAARGSFMGLLAREDVGNALL